MQEAKQQQPSSITVDKHSTLVLVVFSSFFLLCLGAWYFTSRVYRASLPSRDSLNSSFSVSYDGVVPFCLVVLTKAATSSKANTATVADRLSIAQPEDSHPKLQLNAFRKEVDPDLLTSLFSERTAQGVDRLLSEHLHRASLQQGVVEASRLVFYYLCNPDDTEPMYSSKVWHLGQARHGWKFVPSCVDGSVSDADLASLSRLLRRAFPPRKCLDSVRVPSLTHYTLSFSLVNAQPTWKDGWRTWDFEQAAHKLFPFLNKVSSVFTSELESQVVYFASLGKSPMASHQQGGIFYVTTADLQDFVGHTQWNVVTPLSASTLEFMVFVPSVSQAPLYILDNVVANSSSLAGHLHTSFLVPGWGGVVVLQPSRKEEQDKQQHGQREEGLTDDETRDLMGVFVGQLRRICGLLPLESWSEHVLLPAPEEGITDWELDWLIRQRLTENIAHATESLSSLYELLEGVPHMPVADHMRDNVVSAIERITQAKALMAAEQDEEAMRASRTAVDAAQKAFFDPSMLPLLYFPNEHLYAVYAPFFVPVLFPILAAWFRLLKSARSGKSS
eukprot:gb/GEZN01003953.1/.p1 GENE.gb/GEZN01003953.1/~~gb/GEZN01003953.1/.p1  ORF type:complete len:559 (+),score=98.16 gb/GEZN01003953.1/:197-1873(+)